MTISVEPFTRFFQKDTTESIAHMSVQYDADGIIAPATRPPHVAALREIIGSKKILSPGIGAQGGDIVSVAPFVDSIIVGRDIYENAEPGVRSAYYRNILKSACNEPKN